MPLEHARIQWPSLAYPGYMFCMILISIGRVGMDQNSSVVNTIVHSALQSAVSG